MITQFCGEIRVPLRPVVEVLACQLGELKIGLVVHIASRALTGLVTAQQPAMTAQIG